MSSRLLGALAWLCLTIAGITIAMLLLTFVSQPIPARALGGLAALGLVATVVGLLGFALLRRVQGSEAESQRLRLAAKQWLPPAFLMAVTFGALAAGYDLIQLHAPVLQAIGGGLLAAIVVFFASSLGFSRPRNTF